MSSQNNRATCYLCGSLKLRTVRSVLRFGLKRRVYQCESCSFVQLEHKKEDLQKFYQAAYRKKYSPVIGREASSEEIFEMYKQFQPGRIANFRSYIKPSFRWLDIGASAGMFLSAVKPLVKECVGLEYNLKNAAFARKKLGIRMYTEPLQKTDLPENFFDAVSILETLEHIDDPVNFLKTVYRYIKPGGYLFIEVPNIRDVEISLLNMKELNDFYYREAHIWYFSPKTLEMLITRAGFKKEKQTFHQFVNVTTHLRTMLGGGLAPDATSAWETPKFKFNPLETNSTGGKGVAKISDYDRVAKEMNMWLARTDYDYREFLKKLGVADSIIYIARKKK